VDRPAGDGLSGLSEGAEALAWFHRPYVCLSGQTSRRRADGRYRVRAVTSVSMASTMPPSDATGRWTRFRTRSADRGAQRRSSGACTGSPPTAGRRFRPAGSSRRARPRSSVRRESGRRLRVAARLRARPAQGAGAARSPRRTLRSPGRSREGRQRPSARLTPDPWPPGVPDSPQRSADRCHDARQRKGFGTSRGVTFVYARYPANLSASAVSSTRVLISRSASRPTQNQIRFTRPAEYHERRSAEEERAVDWLP
jgi:hypothetical protein